MGKKKPGRGQVGGKHAQQSFPQMVASAAMNVVKPYVNELMGSMANDLSRRVFRQLANIQTRIMAVEEVLKTKFSVSESEIENAVLNVEDVATGYIQVFRAAEANDLLRVSIRTKAKDGEWSQSVKRQVTRLMSQPYSLGSETVEKGLVGMSMGETKAIELEDGFVAEVTVNRISFKPAPPPPPEAPKEEQKNESANA